MKRIASYKSTLVNTFTECCSGKWDTDNSKKELPHKIMAETMNGWQVKSVHVYVMGVDCSLLPSPSQGTANQLRPWMCRRPRMATRAQRRKTV